jgi:hypothetical protein
MLKRMTAKFNGKCAMSGFPITKGDDIMFDTVSRKAYIMEHDDAMPVATPELPERKHNESLRIL